MLQKYIEADFELSNLDTSRIGFIRKNIMKNKSTLLKFNIYTSFFFLFCNIVNIDIFLIHRFLLVFWLFTGCFSSIINLKINFRLGVYYYHFMLIYILTKRKFFNVLSFLLDDVLNHQFWAGSNFLENNYFLYFKNLEILTNYKLARGVYFHRIQQKFYLKLTFEKISLNFFKVYLTSIKLYVI